MSNDEAQKTSGRFPWKEVLAFLGVIITAYIGYLGVRSQIEIPIQTTQTAEARSTQSANKNPTQIPLSLTESLITMLPPTISTSPIATSIPSTTSIPCDSFSYDFSTVDVTIPDGTKMNPGEKFTKVWRLKNSGSCTWTSEYSLVFVYGANMGPDAVPVTNGAVAPGETVDIAIDLVAPNIAGVYRGNYKLRSSTGVIFGWGSESGIIWVEIKVP